MYCMYERMYAVSMMSPMTYHHERAVHAHSDQFDDTGVIQEGHHLRFSQETLLACVDVVVVESLNGDLHLETKWQLHKGVLRHRKLFNNSHVWFLR